MSSGAVIKMNYAWGYRIFRPDNSEIIEINHLAKTARVGIVRDGQLETATLTGEDFEQIFRRVEKISPQLT